MTKVTFAGGVAAASGAAGPLVVAPQLLSMFWLDSPAILSWNGLALSLGFLFLSLWGGLLLSILPNAAGSAALAALGCRYRWVRQPAVWGVTGAVLGGLLQFVFTGAGEGPWRVPVLALAGLACALICRWGTRWSD